MPFDDSIPEYKPKEDKPPKGRTPAAKGKTSRSKSPVGGWKLSLEDIQESLEETMGFLIMGFTAKGDLHCANIILEGSPDLIEAWIGLAKKHNGVRRALQTLCSGGGYLAVATSTLAVALPMMQHHGLYPEDWPTPLSLKQVFTPGAFESDGPPSDSEEE